MTARQPLDVASHWPLSTPFWEALIDELSRGKPIWQVSEIIALGHFRSASFCCHLVQFEDGYVSKRVRTVQLNKYHL